MEPLSQVIFLIDRAKSITGSDAKTAKALGISRGNISDWRHGKSCPLEMQALLAGLCGLNAEQVVLRGLVERNKDTALADRLLRVLGKPLQATGAVSAFAGAVALAIFGLINPTRTDAHALTPQLDNV